MKQIAILTCRKACNVCTGALCFHAWNMKSHGFARYAGEEVSLAAFFHCNGCDSDPETDPGMLEKIERLEKIGVDTVHIGVCAVTDMETKALCPTIEKIASMLRERKIEVVRETHQ
ncbi:MAG: CGGC domain-containing protein [Oscillospiraceae bacterium]